MYRLTFVSVLLTGCIFGPGASPTDIEPGTDTGEDAAFGDMSSVDAGDMTASPDASMDMDTVDMTLPPTQTLVVTHVDDVQDDDGCDTNHCSLREALTRANELAEDGERPQVEFGFEVEPTRAGSGAREPDEFDIVIDSALEVVGQVRVVGPDPNAQRVRILGSDGFGDEALMSLRGPATLLRILFIANAGYNGVVAASGTPEVELIAVFGANIGLVVEDGAELNATRVGLGHGLEEEMAAGGNLVGLVVKPGGSLELHQSVVSDNEAHGIVVGDGEGQIVLTQNAIGVDLDGNARGNGGYGLLLLRNGALIEKNAIGGNQSGVVIDAPTGAVETKLYGNRIGITAANTYHGIDIVKAGRVVIGSPMRTSASCAATTDCNVISGNGRAGIKVDEATEVEINGNFIGLSPMGGTAPNEVGIIVSRSQFAPHDDGEFCRVDGDCKTGLCGTASTDAEGRCVTECGDADDVCNGRSRGTAGTVVIGALTPPANVPPVCDGPCNVITGNTGQAVIIQSASDPVSVHGNYIGLNADGTLAAGNGAEAIDTAVPEGSFVGNAIANNGDGIMIQNGTEPFNGIIANNVIGATPDGMTRLGNGSPGVLVARPGDVEIINNTIAGLQPGTGIHLGDQAVASGAINNNRIGVLANGTFEGHEGEGIRVSSAKGLDIQGNTIADITAGAVDTGTAIALVSVLDVEVTGNDMQKCTNGIVMTNRDAMGIAEWSNNTFAIVMEPIRLAGNLGNDNTDTDTGPNHLLDSPRWLSTIQGNASGMFNATFGRPMFGTRIEIMATNADGPFQVVPPLPACAVGMGGTNVTNGDMPAEGFPLVCSGMNWNIAPNLQAIQSATRAVFVVGNSGAADITLQVPGLPGNFTVSGQGPDSTDVRAELSDDFGNKLPDRSVVAFDQNNQCAAFGGGTGQPCVDVLLPYGTTVLSTSGIDRYEIGNVSSEFSPLQAVPN